MSKKSCIEGEHPVLFINEHWVKYAKPILMALISWILYVICLSLGIVTSEISHVLSMFIIVSGHLLLLTFHHASFIGFINVSTQQVLITNRRILSIRQKLWISDNITDIPLWRISSVQVQKKGFLQQVLDYGSLILNRGELPNVERVPNPHAVHTKLIPQIQDMQPSLEKSRTSADMDHSTPNHQITSTSV